MVEAYKLHGLTKEEYERILEKLGREPNEVELGILGAMWSEHCSYKSSKRLLRMFPTKSDAVIVGPGENAGVVKVDDDVWIAFKVESHNHPSYIEPFNGSATGVGGIIRDVLSMGARPIALGDSLRFGPIKDRKTLYVLKGVVKGISHYGNSIGVPTVCGETFFEECYATNPLVNAFCLGILPAGRMYSSRAKKVGQVLTLVGSSTGRDGIHGAVMASGEFSDAVESKRSHVQVGDPYFGKKLIEALMEIIERDLVVGIQDLGAAGLAGAVSEVASKSRMGAELYLERVTLREEGMNPYEILLSESQERMLLIADEEKLKEIEEIIKKHHLEYAHVGKLTDSSMLIAYFHGQKVVELPVSLIVEEAPIYVREIREPSYIKEVRHFNQDLLPKVDVRKALRKLLTSLNICSKEWVYTQYDYQVGTNTVLKPGGDASILRIKWPYRPKLKSEKLLAINMEGNSRMVYLNPYEGGKFVIAEVCRNLACVGAKPVGISDCLNFGNPERPEVMWQLQEAIKGIAEACEYLGVPIVSGNVSLYNETVEGKNFRNIYPTPIVVGVGIVENRKFMDHKFKEEGDFIFLIGDLKRSSRLDGSEFLREIHGKVVGDVPVVNLEKEKALHKLLLRLIDDDLILSAHDVSTGGLIVCLLECVFGTSFGVGLNLYTDERLDFFLFSENPTRVVVSVKRDNVEAFKDITEEEGLDWMLLGRITEDKKLRIELYDELILEERVEDLEDLWKNSLERALSHTL
ncbi:phosphoribosylformylglycinamidine synthase subunit PurL [Hydrogenobacter thermophilus]|uniref:phosphoribosylformylglycinamidine synthase subunit PurL n=1 Tax=Hydrogenobacter thermophilus TaxID=940 RepID=UPI0030F8CAA8